MEFEIPSTLIALLSFLILMLMVVKLLTTKSANTYSHLNLIPGPKKLPVIGNLHLLLGKSPPHHIFRELAVKYGSLMHLQLGEVPFLIISSVEVAKQVLRTHDTTFANRPPGLLPTVMLYNCTDIGFAPYGEHWRHLRRIFFTAPSMILSAKHSFGSASFFPFQDMSVAGGETSVTVVEWAMSEMIKNPSTLKRAQEEVRQVFDGKGHVDEAEFHELIYLKNVIRETLRLHPPLPFLVPRESSKKCETDGYEIPAKTRVIINAWALGRDPRYWNDADKFIPERFMDSSVDYKGNNLEYIPFGAGRRMCPGMSFGIANVELALATLPYHFDWEMPNGIKNEELDMTEAFGATVKRKKELHLIPKVRRSLQLLK